LGAINCDLFLVFTSNSCAAAAALFLRDRPFDCDLFLPLLLLLLRLLITSASAIFGGSGAGLFFLDAVDIFLLLCTESHL
jgi:hypothetical protein